MFKKNNELKKQITVSLMAVSVIVYLTAFTSVFKTFTPENPAGPEDWKDYKSWYKVTKEPNTGDPTGFLDKKHKGTEAMRDVFINDKGKPTNIGEAEFPYPEGTILVKEAYKNQKAYMDQKKPELTIMVKMAAGSSPSTNDWMFYMGGDGKLSGTGMESKWGNFCGSCHINAIATDFNFMNHKFGK